MNSRKLRDFPDLLSVQDVCDILRVERRTIYKYIRNRTLASMKIAGKYRIPKVALTAFIRDIGKESCYNNPSDDSDALHN